MNVNFYTPVVTAFDENGNLDLQGNQNIYDHLINGGIGGLRNAAEDTSEDADESAYDEFICGLQQNVQTDDAVIILESGHEKLRYLTGSAEIITRSGYDRLDISELARRHAGFMLDNPAWQTKLQY